MRSFTTIFRRELLLMLLFASIFTVRLSAQTGPVVENGVLKSWKDASGVIKIPDGVVEIADSAFYANRKITSIDFNQVRIVGKQAFTRTSSVRTISNLNAVEELRDSAFYSMGGWRMMLFELYLPNLRIVGDGALQTSASGMRYIYLPKVEKLGANLFRNVPVTVDMALADGLKEVSKDLFANISRQFNDAYIITSAKATAELHADTWTAKIHHLSVSSDYTKPTMKVGVNRIKAGERLEYLTPGVVSREEGKQCAGVDFGDGIIRTLPLIDRAMGTFGTRYTYSTDGMNAPVDNPEMLFYGMFDGIELQWSKVRSLSIADELAANVELVNLSRVADTIMPDLSKFVNTRILKLGDKTLQKIDVTASKHLKYLDVNNGAGLTELALPDSLETLEVWGAPQLTTLPWERLKLAKKIKVSQCGLEGILDLSHIKGLVELALRDNKLTELTLPNEVLESFDCSGNKLTRLDLKTNAPMLKSAAIFSNQMKAEQLDKMYNELTDRTGMAEPGKIMLLKEVAISEGDNEVFASNMKLLKDKQWIPVDSRGREFTGIKISGDTLISWNNAEGEVKIPDVVRYVSPQCFDKNPNITSIVGENVEVINSSSIQECENLVSVSFPKLRTVQGFPEIRDNVANLDGKDHLDIGENPLARKCPKLNTPIVGANGMLFYHPKTTGDLVLPPEIKSIAYSVFYGHTEMTGITATGVEEIGFLAFGKCTALKNVNLPALKYANGAIFIDSPQIIDFRNDYGIFCWKNAEGNVTIPNGIKHLGGWLFAGNTKVTGVTIPEGVESIGFHALRGTNITSITLPKTLKSIGNYALAQNSKLTAVTVPESVTEMGPAVFFDCAALASAEVNADIKRLPPMSFGKCPNLKKLSLGKYIAMFDLYRHYQGGNTDRYYMSGLGDNSDMELTVHSPSFMDMSSKPLKKLYVRATLVPVYKERLKNEYGWKNVEILPIDATTKDRVVTLQQGTGYQLFVKNGDALVTSGTKLPEGTKLVAYVIPEKGKMVEAINAYGIDYTERGVLEVVLTDDLTLSAKVADLNIADYEEIATFSTNESTVGYVPYVHLIVLGTMSGLDVFDKNMVPIRDYLYYDKSIVPIIDWGGGRYTRYSNDVNKQGYYFPSTSTYTWNYHVPGVISEPNATVKLYMPKTNQKAAIVGIQVYETALSAVDVKNVKYLRDITLSGGNHKSKSTISTIDFTGLSHLKRVYLYSIPLKSIQGLPTKVEQVDMQDLDIEEFAVPDSILRLSVYRSPLKSLDLSKANRMTNLSIGTIPLDKLDLSKLSNLEWLDIGNLDSIERIDLSKTRCEDLHITRGNVVDIIPSPKLRACRFEGVYSMGTCDWDRFYNALPTPGSGIVGPHILWIVHRESDMKRVFDSHVDVARGKGFATRYSIFGDANMYYGSDFTQSGTGCKDSYAFKVEATPSDMVTVEYAEDNVVKPIPQTIPFGKEITLSFVSPDSIPVKNYAFDYNGLGTDWHVYIKRKMYKHDADNWKYIYLFRAVEDMDIKFNLILYSYAVELSKEGLGTVELSGAAKLDSVPYGTELTVTAEPETGWEIESITAGGVDITQSKRFVVRKDTKVHVLFKNTQGVNDAKTSLLKVFPNPAQHEFVLTVPYSLIGQTALLQDTKGVVLKEIKIDALATTVSVADLATGLYFIRVADETVKLIKH